ncbi:MAG: hypothetical protein JW909_05555 [Planctomycetes bacterium]|nr:hypothetical protein [Planctomycetota bacterium]
MRPLTIKSVAVAAVLVLAGCGSEVASLQVPARAVLIGPAPVAAMLTAENGTAEAPVQPSPFTPIYRPAPGQQFDSVYSWAVRVSAGLVLPDAITLEAAGRLDVTFISYQGPYSLEMAAGFYQITDDDLGGHISVVPVTVGAKAWMEAYPGSVKSFIGLSVGPYIVDHSNPIVEYSSTVGFELTAGLSLETEDHIMAMGVEVGYTVNQPSISIGGTPGDENLNLFSLKANLEVLF